jgi:hypothetical protein
VNTLCCVRFSEAALPGEAKGAHRALTVALRAVRAGRIKSAVRAFKKKSQQPYHYVRMRVRFNLTRQFLLSGVLKVEK